jgi:hypothetical protein
MYTSKIICITRKFYHTKMPVSLYTTVGPVLVEVHVLCYQPSCRSCFQFAVIKFMAADIWFQHWKRDNTIGDGLP